MANAPTPFPCESLNAFIVNSVADGVFCVDKEMTIIFFNQAAADIVGVRVEDAVGRTCHEVFNYTNCQEICLLATSIAQERSFTNRTLTLEGEGGKRVCVSVSAAPLRDDQGRVIGGVETFRDLGVEASGRLKDMPCQDSFTTSNPYMGELLKTLPLIAQSDSTVLLLGESGTGKGHFAKAIHRLSDRSDGPFVDVNCGALPENLIESELFGYKAGAFTDARKDKPGRFHLAEKGTIFLDEIGDLPLPLQAKILRVLQDRIFEPLGSVESVSADVRVVAATNRDLARMVEDGTFRHDLFYRLNVVQIKLMPLRERRGDIPLLAEHALRRCRLATRKDISGFGREVLDILLCYDFPGNIRELENIIEYACILCPGGPIEPAHLPLHIQAAVRARPAASPLTMEAVRYRAAREAVERNRGNRNAACRELGISKDTLRRILSRQGVDA
ncbi:sigma 54-interacting transcriptional regulator OrpR [Fundidesulfovibrio butyratiphilus]